ncbi:E3 ubiquitin-protein ligase TRIM39-like [Tachysurus vachellii]|uniref:E3 ubiquitin-protein ligase TRIM39-like n=1 Tax=Tachysurus vachellii TaxID=175792 RepID=UPI00296AF7EE|nr:E3 ubiquitin-protein ligase TRIM39-like [Tachysurus vachellii]
MRELQIRCCCYTNQCQQTCSQPQGQPIRPGHTICISLPTPYRRPVSAEVLASYRRYHLGHLSQELCSFLERLCSPTLPEQPLTLFRIVQTPMTQSFSTQTLLPPVLVDQRTQTDGCPHAEPCCPRLTTPASPPRISSPPFAYIRPLSPIWLLLPLTLSLVPQVLSPLLLLPGLGPQTTPLLLPGLIALGEDTFELHSVELELEAVEKQIHDLQVKQAELRERKAALEAPRSAAHPSQAQCTQEVAWPGAVHSGARAPRILGAAAEDTCQSEELPPPPPLVFEIPTGTDLPPFAKRPATLSLLSKDLLLCLICVDVLTDPVTTPCGHNLCKSCLTLCWDMNQHCHCPLWNKKFTKRPELKINTTQREVADHFKKKSGSNKPEVLCDACSGEKLKALKSCLDCGLSFCKINLEPHYHVPKLKKHKLINPVENLVANICQKHERRSTEKEKADNVKVFTALIHSIERSQAELLEMMEEKQKAAERKAEGLIKELEQEETLTLSQLQQTLNEKLTKSLNYKLKKTVSTELKRIQQYAVDVTLDPDTAHPELILSADGKQVTDGDKRQNLPDTPQRFNRCICVLGKQSFSSVRFYYEVQVRGKTDWSLGVVRENINRKKKITLTPQNGFWTVILRNENQYKACEGPYVSLRLREKVEVVGVFVDYEEGLVSFYDVKSRAHIYSFTGQTFTEKLYTFFSPGLRKRGKNAAPLIISPVFKTE